MTTSLEFPQGLLREATEYSPKGRLLTLVPDYAGAPLTAITGIAMVPYMVPFVL